MKLDLFWFIVIELGWEISAQVSGQKVQLRHQPRFGQGVLDMAKTRIARIDSIMRLTHSYTGLFLIPWLLVYAASAFCLNHGFLAARDTYFIDCRQHHCRREQSKEYLTSSHQKSSSLHIVFLSIPHLSHPIVVTVSLSSHTIIHLLAHRIA